MAKLDNSLQQLALTLVDSGLIDRFASFADQLGAVAEGFSGVEAAASATDEQLKKTDGARTFGANMRSANDAIQNFVDEFDALNARNAAAARAFWSNVGQTFVRFGDYLNSLPGIAIDSMRRLYVGVKTWLQDRLGATFDWVNDKIRTVERAFHWLGDQVVFNSHVPDMVDGIRDEMARLDAVMVRPAVAATNAVDEAMRDLAQRTRSLLARLFPEVQRMLDYERDLADLRESENASLDRTSAAESRLRYELGEVDPRGERRPDIDVGAEEITLDMERVQDGLKRMTERAQVQTVQIAKSFKDMADDTLGALRRMTDSIKSGGFLGILEGVIGFGLQLGSIGVFGSKVADNINKPRGYATGTNSAARGWAWVVPRHNGHVFSNDNLRGGGMGGRLQVEVVANNDGFGAIVRNHAGQVLAESAPALMNGAANMAQARMAYKNRRAITPGGITG